MRLSLKTSFMYVIYFIGTGYGIVSLRYALYEIYPDIIQQLNIFVGYAYYYHPLINRITFLMHSAGGIFIFVLAPFVFNAYVNDKPNKKTWLRFFFLTAILPLFWPIVFMWEGTGEYLCCA